MYCFKTYLKRMISHCDKRDVSNQYQDKMSSIFKRNNTQVNCSLKTIVHRRKKGLSRIKNVKLDFVNIVI